MAVKGRSSNLLSSASGIQRAAVLAQRELSSSVSPYWAPPEKPRGEDPQKPGPMEGTAPRWGTRLESGTEVKLRVRFLYLPRKEGSAVPHFRYFSCDSPCYVKTCKTVGCPNTDFYPKCLACKECSKKASLARYYANGGSAAYTEDQRIRCRARSRVNANAARRDPNKRAYFIWRDSRKSDRRRGHSNDLTVAFVEVLLKNPCSYCGESDLKKTLDRIDNTKGHLVFNVVVACVRCNYMRRDMPYAAWLCLVQGVTRAREEGLFSDWTGETRKLD